MAEVRFTIELSMSQWNYDLRNMYVKPTEWRYKIIGMSKSAFNEHYPEYKRDPNTPGSFHDSYFICCRIFFSEADVTPEGTMYLYKMYNCAASVVPTPPMLKGGLPMVRIVVNKNELETITGKNKKEVKELLDAGVFGEPIPCRCDLVIFDHDAVLWAWIQHQKNRTPTDDEIHRSRFRVIRQKVDQKNAPANLTHKL